MRKNEVLFALIASLQHFQLTVQTFYAKILLSIYRLMLIDWIDVCATHSQFQLYIYNCLYCNLTNLSTTLDACSIDVVEKMRFDY